MKLWVSWKPESFIFIIAILAELIIRGTSEAKINIYKFEYLIDGNYTIKKDVRLKLSNFVTEVYK